MLTHPASEIIWGRIPDQHLSRHWNLILHQARQALIFNRTHHLDLAFIGHLQQFIENLLMGHNEAQPQVQNMNPAQSTHTASVHQSVSQSAIKLYQRYQHLIQQQSQLEQYISSIQQFIMQLPNHSIENRAAKNCIHRITNNQYVFVDSTSQVSTRQLLALSYIAILDDKLRQASWDNASQQFISALHEIQRGYNEHDGELDQPICAAGTLNKLIEKLQTVHPDCEIRFITKQLAALKLPKVVLNYFTTHLKTHPLNEEDLEHLRLNGIEVIWNELESGVSDCMFNEFGSLYPSQQHDDFKSLIANGIYVDISDVLPPTNSQLASLNIFSNSGNQEPKSCDHHHSNCP